MKDKPKYNMWQNSIWMIVKTWKEKEKKIDELIIEKEEMDSSVTDFARS